MMERGRRFTSRTRLFSPTGGGNTWARSLPGQGANPLLSGLMSGIRYYASKFFTAYPKQKSQKKLEAQINNRGWTDETIQEAIDTGTKYKTTHKQTGAPATRHVHNQTSQSVVTDDLTGGVIHVGRKGYKYTD